MHIKHYTTGTKAAYYFSRKTSIKLAQNYQLPRLYLRTFVADTDCWPQF